ncbi:hypothetical protein V5799_011118, partial [Amblyomma americanum]
MKTIMIKIKVIAEKKVSQIEEAATQKKLLNITEMASHTCLDTTAALSYSIDLDSKNDRDHPLLRSLNAIFMNIAGWPAVAMFLMPKIYKFLPPDYPPESSTNMFKAFVSHLIEERKANGKKEEDFLQKFMDADYDWESDGLEKENTEGKKMSLDQITGHGMSFFIAGVESVSATLVFTAYCLALHPQIQSRAIAEIDKATSEVIRSPVSRSTS